MRRDPCNMHSARAELHHHQDIICDQAVPRGYLHGEEVRGSQYLPMEPQELGPTHTGLASSGGEIHMVATEDVAHGDRIDAVSQVGQGTLDTAVTPRRVLFRHAHDKPLDRLNDPGATKLTTPLAPVKLLGDE